MQYDLFNHLKNYKIPLQSKTRKGVYALVDPEDYLMLSKFKWHLNGDDKRGLYATTSVKQPDGSYIKSQMHRMLMKPKEGLVIDHKNHNKLDNRKFNLRICTHAQNCMNRASIGGSSKYKGVCKVGKSWTAAIKLNNKRIHLGTFNTEEEAAAVYNSAAYKFHGEFAYYNKIKKKVRPIRDQDLF